MRASQEVIQAANGFDHPDSVSHHQQSVKLPQVTIEDVGTMHISHAPSAHYFGSMGGYIDGRNIEPLLLKSQAVQPRPGSDIQGAT